jgi:serine/threonine protein kinase
MLSDFGVAKMLEGEAGATLTVTTSGLPIGTPEYMAPEQWLNQIVPQIDIYALGVVFYELVTGEKPFLADTPVAVMIKQHEDPLPKPSQFIPNLSGQVVQVIQQAMAKKLEERYQKMGEFSAALEALASQLNPPPALFPTFLSEDILALSLEQVREEPNTNESPSQSQTISGNEPSEINSSEENESLSKSGRLLTGRRHYAEVGKANRQLFQVNQPKDFNGWKDSGTTFLRQNDYIEAEQAFRQALKIDPKDPSVRIGLGKSLYGQKKFDEAVHVFRQVLIIDPRNANAWNGLGTCLENINRHDEAEQAFRHAEQFKKGPV